MPELPEVENARRTCQKILKGKRLREVLVKADPLVFAGKSATTLRNALLNRVVVSLSRKGKYFWLNLDNGKSLLIHLGMTGKVGIDIPLSAGRRGLKMVLGTSHHSIALFDSRRFGRIRLVDDITKDLRVRNLGEDALTGRRTPSQLLNTLSHRTAPIKSVLLDQSVFAGVGNWIADEVLYQSRLAPTRPARSLSLSEVRRLSTVLKRILAAAVAARTNSREFPESWLFHYRWGRRADAVTAKKERIKHSSIGGRTTAWVPSVQK